MFRLILLSALCVYTAFPQATTFTKSLDESAHTMGITGVLAGPLAAIPGAPYSAKAVTERVQLLSDGNRISQTTTNTVARDSKGRVYREESLPGFATGNTEAPHMVLIEDPVAGVHITLDSTAKTAFKIPAGKMLPGDRDRKRSDEAGTLSMVEPDGGVPQAFTIVTGDARVVEDNQATTTIDLGRQMIEGVMAKGTKVTHTIPAGTIGNDGPIVITTESWFSPELKVLVMSKSNDPRMGETSYKLTNISRAEPDPALFRIPADYSVKEKPPNIFFYKTNQGNIEK